MPYMSSETEPSPFVASSGPMRLVLCFDGTGDKFHGDSSDTNIVKIYSMLEKHDPHQYHYYQTGIGTYVAGQTSNSSGFDFFSKLKARVSTALDQAVGTSFEDHVLAGYRFVMRYYSQGDHIYIFGFSRGAYTARFLAEMLHSIGLLSRGNEEMVRFAWDTFSQFQNSRGNNPQTDKDKRLEEYMKKFKRTFCRPGVRVHFLGLFDCVNSIGQFEIPFFQRSYRYIASPMATHIRHAVSIHERRLKFKPALFDLGEDEKPHVDFKEAWFVGNHGDVGGGWGLVKGQKHLLSNTPLNWMIQEVLNLNKSESKLTFRTTDVDEIEKVENIFLEKEEPRTTAYAIRRKTNEPHDMLSFGRGAKFISVILWWIIEVLPIFTRLELVHGKWVPRFFPPNLGAPRDIPVDAVMHPSVDEMIKAGIVDKDSIPKRGGSNSSLFNLINMVATWKERRPLLR